MRIEIVAASAKQPAWVQAGFEQYAQRLRDGFSLSLHEVPLTRRSGKASSADFAVRQEGHRMLAAARKAATIVALDERGQPWTTTVLAERLQHWAGRGASVAVLVGGPDGLSTECIEAAAEQWSLSPLTLPHGLVRVIVAEAIYRAWSLSRGHPYHRA